LAVTGDWKFVLPPCSGELIMEKYIHDENLKLYRKVLSATTEDEKRKQLIDLIRQEVAKQTLSKDLRSV
jgi:hypothetical protein